MTAGSALRLGVGDLLHRPGTRRDVARQLVSEGLAIADSSVEAGAAVTVHLTVESTADPGTLTVTGTISAPWSGECRRCLDPISGDLEVDIHEVVARRPLDDEVWALDGDEVDLGAIVRESLLLALPLVPLCRVDCEGPDPERFPAAVEPEIVPADSDQVERASTDPRWSALDQLRFDD